MSKKYRSKDDIIECRPYVEGEDLSGITIAGLDRQFGHPKAGDMIACLPKNRDYRWLITADYFAAKCEPLV